MLLSHAIVCSALILFSTITTSRADDVVYETSIKLQKPKKNEPRAGEGGSEHVPFKVWLPEGVATIRGFVFNPFNTDAVTQRHWQAACRQWKFGILGGNFFGAQAEEFPTVIDAALSDFAEKSGHPEIAKARFCLVGMSAGAGMSTRIAELMPERVIAAGLVCLEVGPRNVESMKVPMLAIFGERDGKQYELLSAKLPEVRAEGGLYAIAIQWRRRHEFARANNLLFPFFDAVICQRLIDPTKPLAIIDETTGWLGDMKNWDTSTTIAPYEAYKGDRAKACWFPDEITARTWQAFVTKDETLMLKQPVGVGDGKPFALHPVGQSINVQAQDKTKGNEQLPITIFSGQRKLGTLTDGTAGIRFENPGLYPIHLQRTRPDGHTERSRPSTIVVIQK